MVDVEMCRRLAGCESTPPEVSSQLAAAAELAERWEKTQQTRLVAEMELRDARAEVEQLRARALTEDEVRGVVRKEALSHVAGPAVFAIADRVAKELACRVAARPEEQP